jgi:hypothetical protein
LEEFGVRKSSLVVKSILFIAISLAFSTSLVAGLTSFDYGDYEGQTVWFNGVGEDNNEDGLTEGWFGTPVDPAGAGDSLYFTPNAFSVESANGDFVLPKNGQLWFTVDAKADRDIDSLEIEEYGDWTLLGSPATLDSYVSITGHGFLTINRVELGGVESTVNLTVQQDMLYKRTSDTVWDDGVFDLLND